ncbi:MAG: 1-acyl-sn-glycerol-3-phosphate acyltransferase [Anaerolineae bacterium]|nr:1-acyl-sn-glycerol-3-phosphate acyltransferase [Anaerolineae bacterium]
MYQGFRALIRLLLHLVMRLEVVGAENFPESGPYILTTNHLSTFDTPLLFTVCPHRIRALAASKHRPHPFYGPLLSIMGSIWVRRGEIDREALRGAMAVLKEGQVLGMAPEGTRARGTYALQEGKDGPAYIATRTDSLIVPVAITGTEQVKECFPHLKRATVRVVVGKPFRLPESGRVRGPKLTEFTEIIMLHIAEMLPEAYRGVYADRVS